MKKLLIALLVVAIAVGVSYAADIITYEAKNGNVSFDHKMHGEKLGCESCHEGTPAAIVVDKAAAHGDTCKGCHKKQSGPTKCGDCHKK